jgi:hypothetical protein
LVLTVKSQNLDQSEAIFNGKSSNVAQLLNPLNAAIDVIVKLFDTWKCANCFLENRGEIAADELVI